MSPPAAATAARASTSSKGPSSTSTSTTAVETNKKLYIKSFRICGFRSYSDSKLVTLSPFTNVVVGPNGSGKSNFFAALEFVLGEREFSQLSHEQRQELLHEGDAAADPVQTAYVEVVFDNSEGRLQLDTDEVVLRRSVGLKKDEFFVNGKHVPKTEIGTLLESAGFSRSNPYYICRQGKVSELCTMSDAQRLALLKEVAGTNVYDSRRLDSERLLDEAQQKASKIDDSIAGISSRLHELQQEKEELEQFRALDRERRALEYLLSDGEMASAQHKLEQVDRSKQERMLEAQQLNDKVEQAKHELTTLVAQKQFAQHELGRLEAELARTQTRVERASSAKTKLELDVRDAGERVRVRRDKLEQAQATLAEVEHSIAQANHSLEQEGGLKAGLDRARDELGRCRGELVQTEQRQQELRAKQARLHKYSGGTSSLQERNAALEREIAAVKANLQGKQEAEQELQAQLASMQQDERDREALIAELAARAQELDLAVDHNAAEASKTRETRDQTVARRKDAWRRAQQQEDDARQKEDALKRAQHALSEVVPFAFQSGLAAVEKTDLAGEGAKVYGPLYALVQCTRPEYRTAVEVAAGNQLLHVVVDSDKTAAQLMQQLVDKRAGRVTFKPLNVLHQREAQAKGGAAAEEDDGGDDDGGGGGGGGGPSTAVQIDQLRRRLAQDKDLQQHDAFPLLDKVVVRNQADEQVLGPAVRAMLGRTLLCRNHQVALLCSKRYEVDCVTLDGDQVTRRGALTGGYVDHKRSRLAASDEVQRCQLALSALHQQLDQTKQQVKHEDQTSAALAGELDRLQQARSHLAANKQTIVMETKRSQRALSQAKERRERMLEDTNSSTSNQGAGGGDRARLEQRVRELEEELALPQDASAVELTAQELHELEHALPAKLTQARAEERRLSEVESECRSAVLQLKTELQENLLRRRDELLVVIETTTTSTSAAASSSSQDGSASSSLEHELAALTQEEHELRQEADEMEQRVRAERARVQSLARELEQQQQEEAAAQAQLEQVHAQVESLLHKHGECVQKKERAARKIREVGNLPQAELDKYRATGGEAQLSQRLAQANTQLKRFSAVNKKAMDQFVSFSEQKQALVQRQRETHEADTRIRDLIAHLDRAKDEAIILTFKHVAHNFREIFLELVPGGTAELRMVKNSTAAQRREEEEDDGEEEEAEQQQGKVSAFVGISPRVSFTQSAEPVPMKQLSGGQKALVALTIMFAIQRSDQAPFYLFDEIDQALDSNHRTAVAALIQRQARSKSRSAQFVVTTFRPEMVHVADRCLGIHFAHKVSQIGPIDKDQALKFIRRAGGVEEEEEEQEEQQEEEQQEEEPQKRQRASSSSSSSRRSKKRRGEEEEEEEEEE